MQKLSEHEALAASVNLLVRLKPRKLKSVKILESKKLCTHNGRPGWEVFFKFEKPDGFLNSLLTIEVDENGVAKVYETL